MLRAALRLAPNLTLVAATAAARCEADPYTTLGVDRKASQDDIRRAYKKKAAKAHPDHGGDAEEFKRLAAAYGTLSDKEKRRRHDAGGFDFSGQAQQQGFPAGGGDFGDAFRLFEEMFGAGFAGPQARRRHRPRVAPREVTLRLSLAELFEGGAFDVQVPRTVACSACEGRGGTVQTCATCQGRGMTVQDRRFGGQVIRTQSACGACGGAGETLADKCRTCRGESVVREPTHAVSVKLPPNARNGYATTLKGAGDDVFYDGGHVRRDVTVIVEEAPHADLQRVGADLLCAKRVPLLDALTGFAIEVPTLRRDDKRGKAFVVRADAADLPVAPDDVWILKGEGMRDSSGARGDLLIRFVVEFPKTLPDEKDRRGRLAPLLGGSAAAPTPPSKRGLFGGLFGGASADEGSVARRAPKSRVEELYRRRRAR